MFDGPPEAQNHAPGTPLAEDIQRVGLGLWDDAGTPIDRFTEFWRGVVYRTARDALGNFTETEIPAGMNRADLIAEARSFFESATRFPASAVVEMAGFDPAYVADRAQLLDWETLAKPAR